jgi:hypothetical protein
MQERLTIHTWQVTDREISKAYNIDTIACPTLCISRARGAELTDNFQAHESDFAQRTNTNERENLNLTSSNQ